MKQKIWNRGILLLVFVLLWGCASHQELTVGTLQKEQAVKLVKRDGTSETVVIKNRDANTITYISGADHQEHQIAVRDVVRVEPTDQVFDYQAYPISKAEIQKNKKSYNTWGYALGGAVLGGAAGLVVALPFWYADVGGIPPYFVAGAGAVAGSIYFAYRGKEKDRREAIERIRVEREAQRIIEEEKKRVEQLKKEREKLKKELEQKKETK